MSDIETMLGDFSRSGWALCGLGILRDNPKDRDEIKWYCSVYPALFGGRVWSKNKERGSYGISTPTISGHGKTAEAAMEDAIANLYESPIRELYANAGAAFRRNLDVRVGDSGRTADGEAGEAARLEGL